MTGFDSTERQGYTAFDSATTNFPYKTTSYEYATSRFTKKGNEIQRLTQELHVTNSQVQD